MRQVKQSVRKMRGTLDFLKLSETGNTFRHKKCKRGAWILFNIELQVSAIIHPDV